MNRDNFIFFELLDRNDPPVRSLLLVARDSKKQEFVNRMIKELVRQAGWDPDFPPKIFLPRDISPSDYVVGTAISGDVLGDDIGPAEVDLKSHIGVFGMTSVGKTTLVKLLLVAFTKGKPVGETKRTFFVWDTDGEYRDLLPLYAPEEAIWLTADELGINPLEIPKGPDGKLVMHPDKWINNLRGLLRLLWLNEPSLNLFCELLHEEYVKRGIIGGETKNEFPCISDMIDVLDKLHVRVNSDRARAKDKLLDRLKSIRRSLPGLDVRCSRDVFKLFGGRSVILDVSDLKDISFPFLFTFMSILRGVVFHSDDPSEISQMEVFEEAHRVLGGHTDRRTSDLQESTASGILRDKRKSKTCGVVVTRLPKDVVDPVLGNLGTVFCLRLGDGPNIRRAEDCVNLEQWQKPEIAQLADQQAIARFSRYGKPAQMVIKDAGELLSGSRPVSREEARERSKPVLDRFPYVKRAQEKVEDAQDEEEKIFKAVGGLPTNVKRVYARIAEVPWELIEDRMDALSLDREAENMARRQLISLGLIRFAGKAGAKHRLFELTERGRRVAEKWV